MVAVLAFGVMPVASQASDAERVRRFAVVVGANHGAEYRVTLQHAARDARKIADVLTELGGIAAADLTLLVDDPEASHVMKALARVREAATAHPGPSSVFLYYSGHANPDALELSGTRLPLDTLRRRLKEWPSGVRLAVLDACHSGAAVIRSKGGKRTRKKITFGLDGGVKTEGYAILTSSAAGEESQESDELRGSFFTHHLVSGLRGAADRDGDRRVTLNEAYRYAYSRTLRHTSRKARVAQHPHVDVALRGGQEVVLTALDDARGARLTVPDSPERARWILYDPERGVVLAEVQSRKTSQVSIRVPPGEIEVYRRAAASVARGTITVAEGDELVLSRDRLTQVSLATYLRKGQAGVSIAAQVGISSFTSPRTNEQFLGALPLMSLGVTVHDVGVYGLDLGVDIGFSSMNQRLAIPGASSDTPFDQRVLEIQVGASLKYRLDFGSFSVSAGPRLGYLYIERAVDVPHLEQQDAHLLAAGAVLSAQWRFSPRISIGLDGRASYVPMPSEGEGRPDRDQFLVELQAAAAFHF